VAFHAGGIIPAEKLMNNRSAPVAMFLLLLATPHARAGEARKSDLFIAGEGGYAAYRIPGIVATEAGTVLAYCEGRKGGSADWGDIDILTRRSTNGGRTWGPATSLVTPPADARQNPAGPKRAAGEVTVNNPVAIADRSAGVVHFLYCVEYDRCFYRRSDDGGQSFAAPAEITATFEQFRSEYDWKVIATGPGHGIQLAAPSKRLVVPVWLSTSTKGPHRPSCVATIYSDDGGRTWERGAIVPTPGLVNPSETAVAQAGGKVILNVRHEGEPHRRAVVEGGDGAGGWGDARFDDALPEPVCMASLLRFGQDSLLFCNPDNPSGRERKNLTVKRSDDLGRTWKDVVTLEPGAGAYSDLARVGDEVLCLYERRGTLTVARFKP
jgi:sialidase-1